MRRRALKLAVCLVAVLAAATTAWAYWTTSGTGSAAATVGTLNAATISVPATSTGSIVVTWTQQASLPGSPGQNSAITYKVERKLGAGTYAPVATGPCSGTLAHGTTSCTDTVATSGSYTYRVVASFAGSWTATSNEAGPVVTTIAAGDTTPPTVTSINRVGTTPTNASSVQWTVVFSETVTGVDATDFALAASGVTGASITGVSAGTDTYTVTVGTGSGTGTLGLNLADDDSVKDLALNPLAGAGPGNGSFTGQVYTLDRTNPAVSSIVRAAASPTNASSVSWTVTFSESVTGVDATDFALANTGLGGTPAINGTVTGSGTTYTVTATTGSGSGSLGLNLVDNDSIADGVGNKLGGTGVSNGNFTGEVYTVDRTSPAVSSIVRAAASPTNTSSVSWTVTFGESVTGVDATDFALANAGLGGTPAIDPTVSGSGTTYTVTATTGTGSGSLGLNLVDNDTIADGAGNKLGGTGVNNGNFTGQVYAIDRTGPTVTALASQDNDGLLEAGDTLAITFSENVAAAPAGAITVTESRSAAASPVLLTITGITTNSNTGSIAYLTSQPGNRAVTYTGGSAALTSSNVITVTVGATVSGNGTAAASSGALQLAPLNTIQDAAGNGATGTFTTAAAFKLF